MSRGSPREEVLGAVKLPVPTGWTAQHQVTIQLPSFPASDEIAFRPNIVAVRQPLAPPGATVDAVAEDRQRTLAHHLPQFEFGIAIWGRLFGQRAVRLTYTWHNGAHRLRQMLVLCAHEGWLYELTFSDESSRFSLSVPEFERWLSTLALAGASPPTS